MRARCDSNVGLYTTGRSVFSSGGVYVLRGRSVSDFTPDIPPILLPSERPSRHRMTQTRVMTTPTPVAHVSHLTPPRRALTSALAAASEAVCFFAVAQPVDEGTELPHVPHPPRHHHLLLDHVGLRKVGPSLQGQDTQQ